MSVLSSHFDSLMQYLAPSKGTVGLFSQWYWILFQGARDHLLALALVPRSVPGEHPERAPGELI